MSVTSPKKSGIVKQLARGTLVWYRCSQQVWRAGQIVEASESEYSVESAENGELTKVACSEEFHLRNMDEYSSEGLVVIDDLTQLIHLHEPAILHSLQIRFDTDKIYTFTGPILIALNPFKRIPNLYDQPMLKRYAQLVVDGLSSNPSPLSTVSVPAAGGTGSAVAQTKPHVFAIAAFAFKNLLEKRRNQTVLISGESGAGKTESTKLAMKFLAFAGSRGHEGASALGMVTGRTNLSVEERILQSNPLLESFGNARTLRNDNSSRFGKWIEMLFQLSGFGSGSLEEAASAATITGARIETYLLEKIRVTDQQQGERNFHILYQCCAAFAAHGFKAQAGMLDMRGFSDHSHFEYLTRSAVVALDAVDDVEEFEATIAAMRAVGMDWAEINGVLNILAGILNIGNIHFADSTSANGQHTVVLTEDSPLSLVVDLLQVSRDLLVQALTTKLIVTKNERYNSPLSVAAATEARDALARFLYGELFKFVVAKTNANLGGETGRTNSSSASGSIGILDIFGFEQFKTNSFEQLCINFTNERLQQYFNEFVFKLEEQLYKKEKIEWDPLDFPDNQDVLDLLQDSRAGIFALLDEECMLPGGSDKAYCSKTIKKYHTHNHRLDVVKTKISECFIIKHFAGPVCYSVDGFMDKNKDFVNPELVKVLAESSHLLVKTLGAGATAAVGAASAKKGTSTVSAQFRSQLQKLMSTIALTDPHFIRCIKPNAQNLADVYDRQSVTEQLRYGGVLQAVQVSRAGFPVRIPHLDFWLDFRCVADAKFVDTLWKMDDLKARVQRLLDVVFSVGELDGKVALRSLDAIGETMVFFKHAGFEVIQARRLAKRNEAAIRVQAKLKAVWEKKRYKNILLGIVRAQAVARGLLARLQAKRLRRDKAVVFLQSVFRSFIARFEYLRQKTAAAKIQALVRGNKTREYVAHFRQHQAATLIQSAWRGMRVARKYSRLLSGACLAQRLFRTRAARLQLRRLKQEAKEVGSLLVKFNKSQEELVDLRRKMSELDAGRIHAQQEAASAVKRLAVMTEEAELKNRRSMSELIGNHNDVVLDLKTRLELAEKQSLEERSALLTELAAVKEELKRVTGELDSVNVKFNESEQKYHLLLKSSSGGASPSLAAAAIGTSGSQLQPSSRLHKRADIQIVGAHATGKTRMLVELIENVDPDLMSHFQEQKSNLIAHYTLNLPSGPQAIRIIDCNGNARAGRLVKDWFPKTHWVFCVYDLCSADSLAMAQEAALEARAGGASVLLLGNKFNLTTLSPGISTLAVDLASIKDFAVTHGCLALETKHLIDAIELIADSIPTEDASGAAPAGDLPAASSANSGSRAGVSSALDSFKSWLGVGRRSGTSGGSSGGVGVLTASLRGTAGLKNSLKTGEMVGGSALRALQEFQDSDSAITCLTFGQEKLHSKWILLAAASKDGTVVVYKIYRTDVEEQLVAREQLATVPDNEGDEDKAGKIEVHSRLIGHTRAITSLFFNLLEDVLVTTSIDKSVRFWSVDTGEMLKVFTDSSPVPVACFLPFNPSVFIAANSNAVLRLVNVQNGQVLQKLKVETEVRALKFDDTGLFLLAGTKNGTIHVLEANDNSSLKFKFKLQLARGGITCITFVAPSPTQPACVLVNSSDSSVTIVDCSYAAGSILTNLTVRHRVKVAHSLLPLKCCFSPSDGGYLISGSEDKAVYLYSLAKNANFRLQLLHHHQVPVVSVATNQLDTLLVSADSLGKIVLWRRLDFNHLM